MTSPSVFNAPSRIILGGYNILGPASQPTLNQYFQRQYSGLGPHTFLTFQVIMFFIDQYWQGQSQVMEFKIDNTIVPGTSIYWIYDSWSFEAGQTSKYDVGFVHIRGRVPHTGSSLKFQVVSTTDASSITAPFGFREVSIYLSNYTTNTSIAICQTTPEKYPLRYNQCDCKIGQAKDSTGVCQNCTNNCQFCFGLASGECYLCNDGTYWTGSGCIGCDAACKTCYGSSNLKCLICAVGYVLKSDGSCSNQCDDPLILVTTSEGSFCESPCNSTEYYWAANTSCLENCPSPLVIVPGTPNFCQSPCSSVDDFIYEDGSCSSSCNAGFVVFSEPGAKYCNNPCPSSEKYLYPDLTCKSACDYPYTVSGNSTLALCVLDLDSSTVEQVKQLTQASAVGNSVSSVGGMVGSLLSASDPASMCLGPFAKMLQYIKFMKITYPPKVELMLESQDTSSGSLSFLKSTVKKFTDVFKNQKVPGKFSDYNVSSSFIVNFWQSALILLVILLFIGVGYILYKNLSKTSKIYSPVETIVSILKWNFFIIMYCGTIGDIVLYSALEFQGVNLDDLYSNISLIVCAGFNILTVIVIVKMLHVNINIRNSNSKKEEIEKKWIAFRAFYETYKDNFFGQQIFLLIFVVRVACFNAIVGYAYDYPLLQALMIIVINGIMAVYLIVMRPLKAKINLIQQITFEVLLLIFNTCVCILAINDAKGNQAIELRNTVGEIIIVLNIIVPFLSTGFILLKIIVIVVETIKNYRKSKKKSLPQIVINKPNRGAVPQNPEISQSSMILPPTSPDIRTNSNILEISSNYLMSSHDLSILNSPARLSSTTSHLRPSLNTIQSFESPNLNQSRSIQRSNNVFDFREMPLSQVQRQRIRRSPYSKEAKMQRRPQYRNEVRS